MNIQFICPHCQFQRELPESTVSMTDRCPACEAHVVIQPNALAEIEKPNVTSWSCGAWTSTRFMKSSLRIVEKHSFRPGRSFGVRLKSWYRNAVVPVWSSIGKWCLPINSVYEKRSRSIEAASQPKQNKTFLFSGTSTISSQRYLVTHFHRIRTLDSAVPAHCSDFRQNESR